MDRAILDEVVPPVKRLRLTPLLLLLAACAEDRAEESLRTALQAAEAAGRAPPLTADALSEPGGLAAALARDFAEAAPALSGLRYSLTARFAVGDPSGEEVLLAEITSITLGTDGAFAVARRTEGAAQGEGVVQDGMACWWVAGRYYTARAHGPATSVPVRADEPARCLAPALDSLTGFLLPFADRITVTVRGPRAVAGREGLAAAIRLRPSGDEPPPNVPLAWAEGGSPAPPSPRRPLFETRLAPRSIEGELVLDAETGAPLEARLDGRFALRKANRDAALTASLRLSVAEATDALVPPAEVRVHDPRRRIFEDRRVLLGEHRKGPGRTAAPLPGPGDAPALPARAGDESMADPPSGEDQDE